MYTYICIHTYVYIHMHTYICIHTYAYIHMHTYICIHTYVYIVCCMCVCRERERIHQLVVTRHTLCHIIICTCHIIIYQENTSSFLLSVYASGEYNISLLGEYIIYIYIYIYIYFYIYIYIYISMSGAFCISHSFSCANPLACPSGLRMLLRERGGATARTSQSVCVFARACVRACIARRTTRGGQARTQRNTVALPNGGSRP
jgi:hypothetical protein